MEAAVAPIIVVSALVFALAAGLAVLRWGARMPGRGDWLSGLGLLAILVTLLLDQQLEWQASADAKLWLRGWIWPRQELGAILVGVFNDSLGIVVAGLATVVAGVLLLNRPVLARERHPERICSGAPISAAGVALAWLSLTPWLGVAGIALTGLGGFLAMGSDWDSDLDASSGARFARERSWGVILAVLGAAVLTSSGSNLIWAPIDAAVRGGFGLLGALLLVSGLFLQLQPFPFLGWLVAPVKTAMPSRIVFGQVFPAWSAFALFFRFEPQLREIGVFPAFGWVAIGSALLSTIAGLLQDNWRQSLSLVLSSLFSLALASLAFTGPRAGLSLVVAAGLGGAAFSLLLPCVYSPPAAPKAPQESATWLKLGIFFSASVATGMVGFVSAGGILHWISGTLTDPTEAAVSASVLLLTQILAWKLAWGTWKVNTAPSVSWMSALSPWIFILLALGVAWTGTLTGGVVYENPDRVAPSLISALLGKGSEPDFSQLSTASWIHWGALFVAILAAWWTAARGKDLWQAVHSSFPRVAAYLAGGYAVDRAAGRLLALTNWTGVGLQRLVDERIWGGWFPRAFRWSAMRVGGVAARTDAWLSARLNRVVYRTTEVPAKLLQLIQSGDIQWYLFFAIGSGIAVLITFVKS